MKATRFVALASSLSSSSSATASSSYFTYTLGRKTLYVPLTSRCNSRTLPQLRGDGFLLPSHVVAALCRVRDAEAGTHQWTGWCAYLDTQEGQQKLPPAFDPVASLVNEMESCVGGECGRQPSVDTLFQEIESYLKQNHKEDDNVPTIVFSGEGEPTLRSSEMLKLASMIKDFNSAVTVRLTTNGLFQPFTAPTEESEATCISRTLQQFVDNGISQVSIGLHTADAMQYDSILKPLFQFPNESNTEDKRSSHGLVCEWIRQAVLIEELKVEVTAVDRPDVNHPATESLARNLGVTEPIRWRSYFP